MELRTPCLPPFKGTPDFMAVEYQAEKFMFYAGARFGEGWAGLAKTAEFEALRNPSTHFTVHFIHDLESVFWQFLWFICSRLPSAYVERVDKTEGFEERLLKTRRAIQILNSQYFGHPIKGNVDRHDVIREADVFVDGYAACFADVYSAFPFLLKPIYLCEMLKNEYVRLEHKAKPMQYDDQGWRFAPDSFREDFYQTSLDVFQNALDIMGDWEMPAQDLFPNRDEPSTSEAEPPTFSSLRPAKRGTDAAGVEQDEDGKGEPKRQRSKVEERDIAAQRNENAAEFASPGLRRSRRISTARENQPSDPTKSSD
jgi:hypothetical protein